MSEDAVTKDAFLGGKVTVFQPEKGFRAGTDSILLAGALGTLPLKGKKIVEFGCGAGGALFPAMLHRSDGIFTAIERDGAMAALAARSAHANTVSERLTIIEQSVEIYAKQHENTFDAVFSNPPYFEDGKIASTTAGKTDAFVESVALEEWLKAMLFVARPQATLVLIHRAAELARILSRLDRQAGEIVILPIRPYPGVEANRVLIKARKGLRAGRVRLLAGLDIYAEKGGEHTPRAKAVMMGAPLDWV